MFRVLVARSLSQAAPRSASFTVGSATPRIRHFQTIAARRSQSSSTDAGSSFVESPSADAAPADSSSGEAAADAALDSVSLSGTGVGKRGGGLRAMIRQRREDRQQRMGQAASASGVAAASSPFPAANGSNWRDSPRIAALKQEAAGGIVRSTHVDIAPARLDEFVAWAQRRLSDAYDNEGFRCGVLQIDRSTGSMSNHTYWTSELALAHCCAGPAYAQVMNELRGFLGPDVAPAVEMRAADEADAWKHGEVVLIGPVPLRMGRSDGEVLGWLKQWKAAIPATAATATQDSADAPSIPLLSADSTTATTLIYRPRMEWDETVTAGADAISPEDDRFMRVQVSPAVWSALSSHPTPPLLQLDFGRRVPAILPAIRISPVKRG